MWNFLPAALSIFGSITQAAGARQAGQAARDNAERQRVAAQFTAAQLEQQAGQSIAASQRQAAEQTRQATLLKSRALALAAASGAGASDPTIVNLMSRISGEGAYRSAVALYQGEEQARQSRLKAAGAIYEGDAAVAGGIDRQNAYNTSATASLLSGAGSLFARYGMGGPGKDAGSTSPVDSFGINWDNV